MPTIFIECTSTSTTNLNTGIQRVVRNILRHAPAVAAQHGYSVLPVRLDGGYLIPVDVQTVLSDKSGRSDEAKRGGAQARRSLREQFVRALEDVARVSLHGLAAILPFDPVRRFAYGPTIRLRLSQIETLVRRLTRSNSPRREMAVVARPGDILLLLDAGWSLGGLWGAIQHFRRNGGYVIGVIYDLIPLDSPSDCLPEHVAVFRAWLRKLIKSADAFIGISGSVAGRMAYYIREQNPLFNKPVGQFYLGCELDLLGTPGETRAILKQLLSAPHHVFIVVGSIEPRKNHALILDAFEQLWSAGSEALLVVLGQAAWKSESIMQRFNQHPELGRRFHVLSNVSDAELDYTYHHASALINASKIEGFGLPIVEAFSRGLPVLCSDIPVFREIAEGKAQFFSLDGPGELAAVVMQFTRDHDAVERPRSVQPWLSWTESSDRLFSGLTKLVRSSVRTSSL